MRRSSPPSPHSKTRKFHDDHRGQEVSSRITPSSSCSRSFVDIHGAAKTKAVARLALRGSRDERARGFAGLSRSGGLGMGAARARILRASAIRSTLTLIPWMPGFARIACDGHVLGKPVRILPARRVESTTQEPRKAWLDDVTTGNRARVSCCWSAAATARSGRTTSPIRSTSRATTTRASPRFERVPGEARPPPCRAAGLDVYQIDPRGCERPVRGQLHLRRLPEDCRQLRAVQDGRIRDRARHGDDLHLSCRKPFSRSHRHRVALSHLDGRREEQEHLSMIRRTSWAWGLSKVAYQFLAGRIGSMRAALNRAPPRPSVQLVPSGLVVGQIALSGSTWAARLYRVRRQQPYRDGAHSPAAGLELRLPDGLVQSVSHDGWHQSPAGLDGRRAAKLDPGKPQQPPTSIQPDARRDQGPGASAFFSAEA